MESSSSLHSGIDEVSCLWKPPDWFHVNSEEYLISCTVKELLASYNFLTKYLSGNVLELFHFQSHHKHDD
ncbi:hypothetical protein ACF0H5_011024 [Mactra antiquata]